MQDTLLSYPLADLSTEAVAKVLDNPTTRAWKAGAQMPILCEASQRDTFLRIISGKTWSQHGSMVEILWTIMVNIWTSQIQVASQKRSNFRLEWSKEHVACASCLLLLYYWMHPSHPKCPLESVNLNNLWGDKICRDQYHLLKNKHFIESQLLRGSPVSEQWKNLW